MSKEPTIEELKAQLKKVEDERDQLKSQVNQFQASAVADWTLRQRTSLSSIFTRPDGGTGLVGSTIAVAGWIKTTRTGAKGAMYFVKVNDGSHWDDIQIIVEKTAKGFEHFDNGTACIAASIYVVGKVVASPAKGQKIEIMAVEVRLLGPSDAAKYPLSKKAHSLEFLREVGHLRPRTALIAAISRVRNALAFGTHLFFQNLGYYYVNTPLITASDCEGAGEMFQVTTLFNEAKDDISKLHKTPEGKVDYSHDFFKKKSFLTVSGQLNGEIYACAMGSVYTFGPTFRAEESFTSRHLAEFWMIEPEIAFADLTENMHVAEQYIKFVLKYAMDKLPKEMEYLENYEKTAMEERQKQIEEEEKVQKAAEKAAEKAKGKAKGKAAQGQGKPTAAQGENKAQASAGDHKAAPEGGEVKDHATASTVHPTPATHTDHHAPATHTEQPAPATHTEQHAPATQTEQHAIASSSEHKAGEAHAQQKTEQHAHTEYKEGETKSSAPKAQANAADKPQSTKPQAKEPKQKKKQVKDVRGFRLQPLRDRINHVINSEFAKITYTEAIEILLKSGVQFDNPVSWGIDLASEHERWMAEEHFKRPTIVRNYPKEIKAFYMRLNEDQKTVAAMDVLVPGVGELIGGSQREERLEMLESRIKEAGLEPEHYSFYLDLRRYGSVTHSGFGLGFERLVCYTTGMENIREAIPFPRWCGHADY